MIRNVLILTRHDLAVAFKNKTMYLMVFIPLFVFFSLNMLDAKPGEPKATRLGMIESQQYSAPVVASLKAAPSLFAVSSVPSREEGEQWLRDKRIDGLLVPDAASGQAKLVVVRKETLQTVAMIEAFSALQRAAQGRTNHDWLTDVEALQKSSGLQKQTLPTWILMIVLLVGLLAMPPQVAEEKEKRLLLGLLQTPMREVEWLNAKILTGIVLAVGAVLFLHALGRFGFGDVFSYGTFLVAGSFCFSALGVLLGFLCRTQAAARACGIFVYLPQLLPSALADFSEKMRTVAALLPSSNFFVPLRAVLLDGATARQFPMELASLLLLGLFAYAATLWLLKRRWLM